MKCDLIPFQQEAVNNLRKKTAVALRNYNDLHTAQVVSLQAPTGAGKTIIMTALIEDIFNGTESYLAQPNAVFVWLSDSPDLNKQSRDKIEAKADKIRFGQCKMVSDASFDQETFEDGYIYFLNTQKMSKNANLCSHSDGRQYTIWETLENTLKQKSDRFYVIIDEAHRGALGTEAGKATSIMQRFIKGSKDHNLSPMPVVIGMSATAERFNKLIQGISSTLYTEVVSPDQVRKSGLLKDRILLLHPDDISKFNELAILERATREWMDKCKHWDFYTYTNHRKRVNPVFVVQVRAATKKGAYSDIDLDEVLARIETVTGSKFSVGEVVHTFGSFGDIEINGLKVPHVEPVDITDNRIIKVVFFKENLSTGWDCPRAETMMSFRTAEDPTYITQLLGRMIRTPLQMPINSDESLNEVHLYLPHFNGENCKNVVDELKASEVDDFPAYIEERSLSSIENWASARGRLKRPSNANPDQMELFDNPYQQETESSKESSNDEHSHPQVNIDINENSNNNSAQPQKRDTSTPIDTEKEINKDSNTNIPSNNGGYTQPLVDNPSNNTSNNDEPNKQIEEKPDKQVVQPDLFNNLDREDVMRFIVDFNLLSYTVRSAKINSYLKSLLMLGNLLTDTNICPTANTDISNDMVKLIHEYIEKLKTEGKYNELKKQVIEMKLSVHIFDMFGEEVKNYAMGNIFSESDEILDPQLRIADTRMGSYGLPEKYNIAYYNNEYSNTYKIDSILFAINENCIKNLDDYSKRKFIELKDKYRTSLTRKPENIRKKYNDIVAGADLVSEHSFRPPERIGQDLTGDQYEYHLFADEKTGLFKANLNTWEKNVLEEEISRNDFVCWIRNKSRANWALVIPYELNGEIKPCYPDFIIIRKDIDGYIIDVLEPHNPKYDDNLAKAQGFVRYIQKENRIGRIQIIRKVDDKYKRLDMSQTDVQEKVLRAVTLEEFNNIFDTYGFYDKK